MSYMVRAERFEDEDVYHEQKNKVILKEIHAALKEDKSQTLRYAGLTMPESPYLHPGAERARARASMTLAAWRRGLRNLTALFEAQAHIFIPHYNRRKNVSDETHTAYMTAVNNHEPTQYSIPNQTKPADLMVLYHQSGFQVPGPMEMRFAWRYNDLKGRTYYATGGDAIFAGLFIKSIVKDLLNILPSTHTRARYDPRRVTWKPLQRGEVLVTYDYSSFTTSLAELKYFLTYLARQLGDITIRVLDVYEGIIEVNLGEYIQAYNTTVNHNAEFDVRRVDICESLFYLHQVRSGMLGAQGNIGFSTLLHGLSTGALSDSPSTTCVVGDDALLRVWRDYLAEAISKAQNLCEIEASKFHIWYPSDWYTEEGVDEAIAQSWQFLKRPLNLDEANQVSLGFLPTYPSFAELLLPADGIHVTSFETSLCRRFLTFAKQWGRFLSQLVIHNEYEISFDEILACLIPIQAVYLRFNIPFIGLPSGSDIRIRNDEMFDIPLCVPPCTSDVFFDDWVTLLVRNYSGTTMTIPVLVYQSIPVGPCLGLGHIVEGTLHRIQRVMEDLGYFKTEIVKQDIVLSDETEDLVRDTVRGTRTSRMLHRITCISESIPAWYNDIVADEGPL
jgi:hypothetical protein